jgi:AcrR family transcriptional regulator
VQVETPAVTQSQIIEVARRVLSSDGAGAVSLGKVARQLDAPLALVHEQFGDDDALLARLAADALLAQILALESAEADLLHQAHAYRRFALAHPREYRLITESPVPREPLSGGSLAHPPRAFVDRLGPELAAATWAFVHGMVELELDGRLPAPVDLDAVWRAGVAALAAAADSAGEQESQQ